MKEIGQVQMWKIANSNEKSYCWWREKGRNRQTKREKIFCKIDWETNYLQDAIAEYLVASFKIHSTQRSFEEKSRDRLQLSDYVDTQNNLKNAA